MGSGASVLSLKQTEGPHRKAGRASVCAARIVPSHTDAIQRAAGKTHTKNGQRQPEIPTAAAIFDEKCIVLFEEAPCDRAGRSAPDSDAIWVDAYSANGSLLSSRIDHCEDA